MAKKTKPIIIKLDSGEYVTMTRRGFYHSGENGTGFDKDLRPDVTHDELARIADRISRPEPITKLESGHDLSFRDSGVQIGCQRITRQTVQSALKLSLAMRKRTGRKTR